MAKKQKYYIKPSQPGTNSWSVFERGKRNRYGELYCIIPQVTLYQAQQCAKYLNAGRGAWDWERDMAPDFLGSLVGGGY